MLDRLGQSIHKSNQSSPNHFFLSIWLGISLLLGLLTLVSLGMPLSPPMGLAIIALLSTACLMAQPMRARLHHYFVVWRQRDAFIFLSIFVLVAIFSNQRIEWFDTGLYHLGLIHWLSEFGATPGIALINFHFGKFSSWFALSAPLLFDFSQNRVGAVTNGFFLLIACLQLVSTLNATQRSRHLSDGFAIAFLSLYLANLLFLQPLFTTSNLQIALSFSPDVPVNLFIGIVAWAILVVRDEADAHVQPIFMERRQPLLDVRAIPLIVAAAAVTVKVTAFPLVAIAALFYLSANPKQDFRWLLTAVIPLTFLLPFFAHGILASGCPLSPSPFLCVDVPWALGVDQSAAELARVTGGSYETSTFLSRWYDRIRSQTKLQLMALLLMLSATLGTYLIYMGLVLTKRKDFLFVVGLAWSGIAFLLMVSTSQILRFGLGYFLVVPCLFVALVALRVIRFGTWTWPSLGQHPSALSLGVLGIMTCFIVSHSYTFGRYGEFGWVLPPPLPTPANYRIHAEQGITVNKMMTQEVNGIVFKYPSAGNAKMCWSDELVCNRPKPNIHLRRPSEGLAGGFVTQPSTVSYQEFHPELRR